MKKLFFILLLLSGATFAQNFQVHYDFGKDENGNKRDYVTTTFEMFKPDEYGSTFTFVDFDFNGGGGAGNNKSASLAYFEIARYVNLPFITKGLSVTAQYNDGAATFGPLGNVWLAGFSYPIDLGFVTLNTDLLYRTSFGSDAPDAQLTTVWYTAFLNGKLSFTGFLDLWTKDKNDGTDDKTFVLLTEPQIWYNVWNHLHVGTEIEISSNFVVGSNRVEVMPTAAVKWVF